MRGRHIRRPEVATKNTSGALHPGDDFEEAVYYVHSQIAYLLFINCRRYHAPYTDKVALVLR